MTDERAEGPASPRGLTEDEVRTLWDAFRAGSAACPRDHAPLALAVDASTKSYRLVCTHCGISSPWFEPGPNGIRLRNVDDAFANPNLSDD